ncbi:MAG TPA: sulfite exporter TauE/SafE family protein [Candidatus Binatia bacterium]|nr:sulfite exporter TauE/SafE family protein [Candidatus Binatia bacterium]
MEILVGFLIAIAIGLTGVGAGIITAPVLMTLFHVPAAAAVGTALTFGAVTKLVIVPVYATRRQVNVPTVVRMLAGGLPGVAAGSLILAHLDATRHQALISLLLGLTILIFALMSLGRIVRPSSDHLGKERPWWLAAVSLPIGAEVGFSSAGSGSLASLALMSFTRLETATIVGTDVCFGLGLSLLGGGILFFSGHYDPAILPKLLGGGIAGAILAPNLAAIIPARPLRVGLLIWILFLGGQLVTKGLGH